MIVLRRNQQSANRYWVRPTVNFTLKNANRQYRRNYYINPEITTGSSKLFLKILAGTVAATTIVYLVSEKAEADSKVDYEAVRKDIEESLEDNNYDDGSYGPIYVRLAWHASGTYDKGTNSGGSDGATMRFEPESGHGANAGLINARDRLEKIKQKYPGLSYADLWTLAGAVSIEAMGGPKIQWRPGRSDKEGGSHCPPDGRLPDASKGAQHLRDIFYRMGFNDREIVALAGAHALGRCHTNRSGYNGPWTHSPTVFTNEYFVQLLNNKWTKKKWNGPEQFEDQSGKLMMLPADLSLIQDPEFLKYVKLYADNSDLFFKDFAVAFQKLEELGVNFKAEKPWWKFW